MRRLMLVGLVVVGMFAPLVWLSPFRYFQERRAIRETILRYPTIKLRNLEIASRAQVAKLVHEHEALGTTEWTHGIILHVSAPTDDEIVALRSFRRAIRNDPTLEKTFERPEIDILNGGWRLYDPSETQRYPSLELRFIFFPKAR